VVVTVEALTAARGGAGTGKPPLRQQ
jgi:hypothetical protein